MPPPMQANPKDHVMGNSLKRYVKQKLPPDIFNETLERITVTPVSRCRDPPQSNPAIEQLDSRRPEGYFSAPRDFHLACFPSENLVFHYASLAATYRSISGQNPDIVRITLQKESHIKRVLFESNLRHIGKIDTVIFGDVQHLQRIHRGQWEGAGASHHDIFRWSKCINSRNQTVVLLGCLERIWGDTGYHLLEVLKELSNIKCAIYIAKAGSLPLEFEANQWIATGDEAFLEGEIIRWASPLQKAVQYAKEVVQGAIVTVKTPLCETREWFEEWSPKASWVDCEAGYVAKAAKEHGISFGYLHIISDNLQVVDGEDLSNEDLDSVVSKRGILYDKISDILDTFMSQ
ncbi:unnamed protein product [Clonostachys chloroleuca]|uniref:Nucleoside phosphorylase domain-containing protein n=1 Tax=Clonostachys chloroleuca TaxID=1926264 RepID=A0AA35Q4F1_9HYPO|nr:unnamed protein product [Clonostachys chloroleuca]